MSITIHWWYIAILLVLAPLVYSTFRKPVGMWDLPIDTMFLAAICWTAAIVLTISRFIWSAP